MSAILARLLGSVLHMPPIRSLTSTLRPGGRGVIRPARTRTSVAVTTPGCLGSSKGYRPVNMRYSITPMAHTSTASGSYAILGAPGLEAAINISGAM